MWIRSLFFVLLELDKRYTIKWVRLLIPLFAPFYKTLLLVLGCIRNTASPSGVFGASDIWAYYLAKVFLMVGTINTFVIFRICFVLTHLFGCVT